MPNCGICGDRIFLNRPYIRDDDSGKIFHQKCTKTHCMACGDKVDKTKPYGLHKVSGSVFHSDCMDKPKSAGKTKKARSRRSPKRKLNPSTFTVYFDGKQEDVQAEGQWDAMQKVIQKHKIPKKRQGLVSALHKGTEAQSYMFNPDSEEYSVYNATDGIYACPFTFESRKEAEGFIRSFRERFKVQGYYLTSNGNRISPDDVVLEIVKSNPESGVGLTTKEDFLKWWSQGLSLGLIKTDGNVWQGPDSQRFLDWWAHGFTLGILKSKKPYVEKGGNILNYIARAFTLSILDVKGGKPTVMTNPNLFGLYTNVKGWMVAEKDILQIIKKGDQKAVVRMAKRYSKYGATDTVSRELISKKWDTLHPKQPFNYDLWYTENPCSTKYRPTWKLHGSKGLGGAWDDIDFTEIESDITIPKGSAQYNHLKRMGDEEWANYLEYHEDQGVQVDYDKNTDTFIVRRTAVNPSELTHAEALSKASWHRGRGRRARVMPVAGGHDTNEYGVFLDGMRQHLPKKERVAAKAKAKPQKLKMAPKPQKAKVTKPVKAPVQKKAKAKAEDTMSKYDIAAEYDIPKAPKIPKYEIIQPTSDAKVKDLYKDWHDFYDKFTVYSSGIDRIVQELNDKVSSLPPRDKRKGLLKDEIQKLKDERDTVSGTNENTYLETLIEGRAAAEEAARERGLTLSGDETAEFVDEFYMEISHERPYVEQNWNRPVVDVFNEVVARWLERTEPTADTIEEMPPEPKQSEISSDELANQITKSLEALLH